MPEVQAYTSVYRPATGEVIARTFARRVECGMVGVNLGVPAPMALFSLLTRWFG